jgi:hypothetical protein
VVVVVEELVELSCICIEMLKDMVMLFDVLEEALC